MTNNTVKKLEECFFFLRKMEECERSGKEFCFFVSAFLSASRSVTFVMQKEGRNIAREDFDSWYDEELSKWPIYCGEFLKYRNTSEKEGVIPPISGKLIKTSDGCEKLFHYIIPPYSPPSKDEEKIDFVSLSKLYTHELLKIVTAFCKGFSLKKDKNLEDTKEEIQKLSIHLQETGFPSKLFDDLVNEKMLTDISEEIEKSMTKRLAMLNSQIEREVADIKRYYKL